MEPRTTFGIIGAYIGTILGSATGSLLIYVLCSKLISLKFTKKVSLYVSWVIIGLFTIIATIFLEVSIFHYVFLVHPVNR